MNNSDAIPDFSKAPAGGGEVGVANMSALTAGPGIKSFRDVLIIALVAVVVIDAIAAEEPDRFIVIDGTESIEVIAGAIWQRVKELPGIISRCSRAAG